MKAIFCAIFLLTTNTFAQDLGVIQPYLILGGSQGKMLEQFNEPDAVAFMKDGRLLAGDTVNGRFKIYSFSENALAIKTVGTPGNEPCQFDNSFILQLDNGRKIYNEVQGIACNSKNEIFVVDQGNRRILVFSSDGICLRNRTIPLADVLIPPNPAEGTTYTSIQGLALDSKDNIYLSDTGTRQIYKFTKHGKPDPKFKFQAKTDSKYILKDPESLILYKDMLLVADEGNHTIKAFDSKTGTFTGTVIGHPDLFSRDVEGLGIHNDMLFAINEEDGEVLIFNLSKPHMPYIGKFGEKGLTPGRMRSADGLAISPDGKFLAVADQGNFRIQIFLIEDILRKFNSDSETIHDKTF